MAKKNPQKKKWGFKKKKILKNLEIRNILYIFAQYS